MSHPNVEYYTDEYIKLMQENGCDVEMEREGKEIRIKVRER